LRRAVLNLAVDLEILGGWLAICTKTENLLLWKLNGKLRLFIEWMTV